MGTLLAYILQSGVIMAILYACYKLLLSSATFHSFKRFVLIAILAMSWILPAFVEPISSQPVAPDTSEHIATVGEPVATVEVGMPLQISVQESSSVSPWWYRLSVAYVVGAGCAMLMLVMSAIKLYKVISRGRHSERDGYTEVVSDTVGGPLSWGRYIVLRPQDFDNNLPMVLRHELRHISRLHWLDIIMFQINVVVMWFNPIAYLALRELKRIHEYEADEAIEHDQSRDYQLMLINKTVGSGFPTLANSLNHSQIYKRITMMMKNKSKGSRRLAALALPGAAMLSMMLLSQPSVAHVVNNLRGCDVDNSTSERKISQNPSDEQIVEAVDMFMGQTSGNNVAATTEGVAEQMLDDADGVVEEPVKETTGQPAYFVNGELYTGNINDLEPGDIASMTIVKDDPAYPDGKIMIELKQKERAYDAVEELAEFPGGQKAMLEWMCSNLRYPEAAIKNNAQGRVIVQFVVEKDGTVSSPQIMRGVDKDLDMEALRLVRKMPKWQPARVDGEPVASKFVLPVSFSLKDSSPASEGAE